MKASLILGTFYESNIEIIVGNNNIVNISLYVYWKYCGLSQYWECIGTHVNEGNVGLEDLPVEELRNLVKKDRDTIPSPLLHCLPHIASHEHRQRPETNNIKQYNFECE